MTEIRIRDGVVTNIPTSWNVKAWDSTHNNDNIPLTNDASQLYSTWSEWGLSSTYNMVSTWGANDAFAGTFQSYAQNTQLESSVTLYPSLYTNTWAYNGSAITLSAGGNDIFGAVIQFAYDPLTVTGDIRQLLLTLGAKDSENEPIWSGASMGYWYDDSNDHHYFECRVNEVIKKVKINGFNNLKPHLYAIRRGGAFDTNLYFYVDYMLVATIPYPSGALWEINNSTTDYDMWWYQSDYGYVNSSGTVLIYSGYVLAYTLFWITTDDTTYDHNELVSLCRNRYGISNSEHTTSTSTITLNGSNFGVFGTSTFNTVFL